jgi:hypothetical protein
LKVGEGERSLELGNGCVRTLEEASILFVNFGRRRMMVENLEARLDMRPVRKETEWIEMILAQRAFLITDAVLSKDSGLENV